MEEMHTSIDKETSRVTREKCFEFVQQVVIKKPKVLKSTSAFAVCIHSGVIKACNVAYFQETTMTPRLVQCNVSHNGLP